MGQVHTHFLAPELVASLRRRSDSISIGCRNCPTVAVVVVVVGGDFTANPLIEKLCPRWSEWMGILRSCTVFIISSRGVLAV